MKHILFVDDDPLVLNAIRRTFQREGDEWSMAFALGGEAALEELAKAPFDVVVTDMRMPGMDGPELLCRVRDMYPGVARIALSGHADRETIMRALPVSHQYLSKPFEREHLRGVIERTCELGRLIHDPKVREVVGRMNRLPSAGSSYMELTRAVADPRAGISAIARIVEEDAAMSAKVLQLVNSSYFGLPLGVTSVRRAVLHLGLELIKGLALTAHVFSTLEMSRVQGFSLDALQEHSLRAARLAKSFLRPNEGAEQAFTAALVHDLGRVIVALGFPDRMRELMRVAGESSRPWHEVEKELFGVTHAEVGAYLLGVWGLPFDVVQAVAYHHTPALVRGGERSILAAVHVADVLLSRQAAAAGNAFDAHLTVDEEFVQSAGLTERYREWCAKAEDELAAEAARAT
jgi:HD-like signal output (HDOD) protein